MSTELTGMGGGGGRRGGFTLVELLVVIGIIAILASIGLVVASKAVGTAKSTATASLLQHMGTAFETFKNDFGDYPPLITRFADYSGPDVNAPNAIATPETWGGKKRIDGGLASARQETQDEYKRARWYSEWTPAAYLLGVGDLNGDGDTDKDTLDMDDGKAGPGFRNPGEQFRAWTKIERVGSEQKLVHEPEEKGPTYGPYLDIANTDKFVERVAVMYDDSINKIQAVDNPGTGAQYLYRFVDPWGNPIRFYRNWQTYDPNDPNRKTSVDFAPVELRSYESLNKQYEDGTSTGSIGLDPGVTRAPYMLLSAGADPNKYTYADGKTLSPFGDAMINQAGDDVDRFQESVGSFDSAFDPFGSMTDDRATAFLKMIESNVRYNP